MPIQAKEQNQDPLKVAFDIFSKGAKRFQCLAQNTNSLALFFFFVTYAYTVLLLALIVGNEKKKHSTAGIAL